MAECGELSMDLLESIFDRLTLFSDMVSFGAVCKSWWSVYAKSPHHVALQLPGLFIPSDGSLFTLNDSKITMWNKIPEAEDLVGSDVVVGAFEGWLIVINKLLDCYLLHPFSSDFKITLPSFTTLPDILDVQCSEDGIVEFTILYANSLEQYVCTSGELFYVEKVVLSSNPGCSDFIAMGIVGQTADLAFYKSGDLIWTRVKTHNAYDDIIYYQDKFYAVGWDGKVVICDIGPPVLVTKLELPLIGLNIEYWKKYLVESDGELLLVARHLDTKEHEEPYVTDGFKIFKLDSSGQSWSRVNNLGSRTLFLGQNCSLSVSARDFSGCKANHIYFTDDKDISSDGEWGGHDLGVFNIEDGTFQPHFPNDSQKIWPRPIWITHIPSHKSVTN